MQDAIFLSYLSFVDESDMSDKEKEEAWVKAVEEYLLGKKLAKEGY
jgi:hypothetical protein